MNLRAEPPRTGALRAAVAPGVSVCIPAYEMGGQGAAYLREALDSLARQTCRDFEVVVADQSRGDDVARVCAEAPPGLVLRRIDTRHLRRGSSANANAALDAARGDIVKILFQDDYLFRADALVRIADALASGRARWLLCGAWQADVAGRLHRPMLPRFNPLLALGRNTIGSPSVLAVRRDHAPRFDETLDWFMDVDFYLRCRRELGAPVLLEDWLVVNRRHPLQRSAQIRQSHRLDEGRRMLARHRDDLGLAGRLYAWWKFGTLAGSRA